MSWDSYIDNLLGNTNGQADKACIMGKDGSLWTTSAHESALQLSADEVQTIARAFNAGDFTTFQASGVLAEGVKYQFLRGDGNLALARKKDYGALTLQASQTAVVIAHTKEGSQQGDTNKGVGVIAEYLESLGM